MKVGSQMVQFNTHMATTVDLKLIKKTVKQKTAGQIKSFSIK